ncbi:MAG: UDP-N-acetylmuramate--L-alanine ligase [Geminicoccaceae bacterium]
MKIQPLDIGPIHFVGIGGIGMSGIAEILCNMGYRVQGSDIAENANTQRLAGLGAQVVLGHAAENVDGADVLVVSSAISASNPELVEARRRRIPVVRRADMLGELMRLGRSVAVAGTHGKTTTTAIIAGLFDAAGLDPTVINGGIINAYGTNARLGQGEWMVVEADESDGSFLRLPATIGVVTNIDPEHMEHYGSFEAVREAYLNFVERLPFYGFAVLCTDHPEVQSLLAKVTDRRIVTYGLNAQADVRALDIALDMEGSRFDVQIRDRASGNLRRIEGLRLTLRGEHNLTNALAAVAIGTELGLPDAAIRDALAGLRGVKRRFTVTGVVGGITIVDDYAHHPVEIRAVLATARASATGRVIAIMQPHRYSRLHDLFDGFCTAFSDADVTVIAPVHAAGEEPIEGFDRDALVEGLRDHGQRDVIALEGPQALAELVDSIAEPGDIVLCMGAGSITYWAAKLPGELEARRGS